MTAITNMAISHIILLLGVLLEVLTLSIVVTYIFLLKTNKIYKGSGYKGD